MPKKELYDFRGELRHKTQKALLVYDEFSGKEVWFPLSVIEDNDDGTFTIPMSWAVEKEIV